MSDCVAAEGADEATTLNLAVPRVSDVSPLNDPTNLTNLSLYGTQVSDLSPLKGIKNLQITGP